MAKPVIFGSFSFSSKKAAIENIQDRIRRYSFGDLMREEDKVFFSALFVLHDEYESKIGSGIEDIQIKRDFHGNKCLYIMQTDGSGEVISWRHCVQPYSKKKTISNAFRRTVKRHIIEFKKKKLSNKVFCPILGVGLDFQNSHVAYVNVSFEQLLESFISESGLDFDDIELSDSTSDDNDQRGHLSDDLIRFNWLDFHNKNAELTLLSAEANLKRKNN